MQVPFTQGGIGRREVPVVRNNFLKNIKGKNGAHQAVGLYLDDQGIRQHCRAEHICGRTIGVLVGGGRDNVIRNNIFVNNRSSIAVDARGVTWQKSETMDRNWTLWKNLLRMPVDSPAYRKKYPIWPTCVPMISVLQSMMNFIGTFL